MKQKFTILFDLDGTLVDTAPDLIRAHNQVMKKFGYPTKTIGELKNAVGKGAKAMMAKANGQWKWFDEKIQNKMSDEFLSYYGKNILNESTLMPGVKDFLNWCKKENISMAVCTNKTEHLAVDLLKKIRIYDYFEYAVNAIPPDHPHYHEIRRLLISQVNDELHDHATYNRTDRRAS